MLRRLAVKGNVQNSKVMPDPFLRADLADKKAFPDKSCSLLAQMADMCNDCWPAFPLLPVMFVLSEGGPSGGGAREEEYAFKIPGGQNEHLCSYR